MSESQSETSQESTATNDALEGVATAVQSRVAEARDAANRTWDASSRFASRFIYTTCYTVSYGVVFPSVLLARALPRDNAAVRGMVDGAHAAIQRVDAIRTAEGTAATPV